MTGASWQKTDLNYSYFLSLYAADVSEGRPSVTQREVLLALVGVIILWFEVLRSSGILLALKCTVKAVFTDFNETTDLKTCGEALQLEATGSQIINSVNFDRGSTTEKLYN